MLVAAGVLAVLTALYGWCLFRLGGRSDLDAAQLWKRLPTGKAHGARPRNTWQPLRLVTAQTAKAPKSRLG
ncbi:MAG: hypothetical protein Kow00109_26310 [Acidobacteriota bacterium]